MRENGEAVPSTECFHGETRRRLPRKLNLITWCPVAFKTSVGFLFPYFHDEDYMPSYSNIVLESACYPIVQRRIYVCSLPRT